MICAAMASAAAGRVLPERAEHARDARVMRALALIVDALLLGLIYFVVNSVYGVSIVTSTSPITPAGGGWARFSSETTVGWLWLSVVWLAYFTILEGMFGATPGKWWNRLRVVRLDGQPLRPRDVVIRNLLRLVDALPFLYLLGGVSVLATSGSQRLGDLAAGTTVVYRHRALDPGATRRSSPFAARILAAAVAAALACSAAFAYFGRPQLVIAGLYNERQLLQPDVYSYTLGTPEWGPAEITYPITAQRPGTTCTGSLTLRWSVLAGWQMSSAQYSCPQWIPANRSGSGGSEPGVPRASA